MLLHKFLGELRIPLLKKHKVPASKRIGADLFKSCCYRDWRSLSAQKKLKTFAKVVGTKTVRKQFGGGKKKSKRKLEESFLENVIRNSFALAKTFLTK